MKPSVHKRALDMLADEAGDERVRAPKLAGPKLTITIGEATEDPGTDEDPIDLGTLEPMDVELDEDEEGE